MPTQPVYQRLDDFVSGLVHSVGGGGVAPHQRPRLGHRGQSVLRRLHVAELGVTYRDDDRPTGEPTVADFSAASRARA